MTRSILLCLSFFCSTLVNAQSSFSASFDSAPDQPTSFYGADNWAFFLHSRNKEVQYQPYTSIADHGPNCEPPIRLEPTDTYDTTHLVQTYEDMVYVCRNHLMTNIRSDGYGLINLMPNQLVDFSEEEAIIRWDVSTLNRSEQNRDWFTVSIMPLEDLNPLHAPDWAPDLEGRSKNTLRVETSWTNGARGFELELTDENFEKINLPLSSYMNLEDFISPSQVVRTTFELRISQNHLKLGMQLPEEHPSGESYHWWVDTSVDEANNPLQLTWNQGAVLFGHYSYNPRKNGGMENTWHWDNLYFSPAKPFSIIGTDHRYADENNPLLQFEQAAPEQAVLHFAATDYLRLSDEIELRFNEGPWLQATRTTGSETDLSDTWGTSYVSYQLPIPAGTTTVEFRGENSEQQLWMARDVYIISDENLPTSTAEISTPNLIKVYPNPIASTLFIEWLGETEQEVRLSLFDVTGRKFSTLYDGVLFAEKQGAFDVSMLQSGIYYLEVNTGAIIKHFTLMKL